MLEVNDFNQVRISLASPEQIRNWSYGEVTKPETINYRTLKPEKDGLFCEKIFGPMKDFECYCGKYKRVRYKGIICDKCGVEVARAKVRRERMGHIELASPVSHIWFVKGTPSKLGLLLDISPRNLEKVLYFAQYLVTEVDAAARDRELERIQAEKLMALDERLAPDRSRVEELEQRLEKVNEELQGKVRERAAQIQAERKLSRDALAASAAHAVELAEAAAGGAVESAITLLGDTLIEAGAKATKAAVTRVQKDGDKKLVAFDKETAKLIEAESMLADTALDDAKSALYDELHPLQTKRESIKSEVEQQYNERIRDLEELKDPILDDQVVLLPEVRYRELSDLFNKPGSEIFKAGMGAEAVLHVLERVDLDSLRAKLKQEILVASGQRRKKATKRLNVVEALKDSGNKPMWMVFQVLPVLPPELRPMVQLDGGRFATSDLNDLYRRVINRNNRLKRLLDLGAPEIIIRNEKRMLQEAVDSLIDNGRRGRAVSGSGNHKLKSLSDMLKGKQGRFRQNLLGKRVDYSGRSVIVVGPELKLNQCGLPKRMALELFKPFVMHSLVAKGIAHNIKSAKRIVERARPEVWDVLDEVIKDRPVLLNRAPTLHRLGIQAFQPVLIEGSAIQLHPLVCSAFNADFDGDQMAVHVPLSREAVAEAKQILLSTNNLLSPASGDPIVAPSLDMVLGCYYMTDIQENAKGAYREADGRPVEGMFGSFEEAKLAFDLGVVDMRAPIRVRTTRPVQAGAALSEATYHPDGSIKPLVIDTTVGRILFNDVVPEEVPFQNHVMDRPSLRKVVAACYRILGGEATAEVVDRIKNTGFHNATRSGITIAIHEIQVPKEKPEMLRKADLEVDDLAEQYQMGLITDDERYQGTVDVWAKVTKDVENKIKERMSEYGSLNYMASSGTKGNITQIRQMAGMRGLMADPNGKVIELPIRGSFREGLTVLEYFISTHGARKGLADTALRTADSGYLTRRLIDVAQDVIILHDDCETTSGLWIEREENSDTLETLRDRIIGRYAAMDVVDENTGEVLCRRNEEISEAVADQADALHIPRVLVRTPMSCEADRGICALCYGRDLGRGGLVKLRTAVGIIAAQSIGEPGTQLTMRTFHTGGVASATDITSGLPRVEELFEARTPKGEAIISEIDGTVEVVQEGDRRIVRVTSIDTLVEDYTIPTKGEAKVKDGDRVMAGAVIAAGPDGKGEAGLTDQVVTRISGVVRASGKNKLQVVYEEREERQYPIPAAARLFAENGSYVNAGAQLTEGARNPQHILSIQGRDAVRKYMVDEVQKVYKQQGVNINDKHIEVITRQMLRRVRVDHPGDTGLLPGDLVDRREFEEITNAVVAEGGEPATAQPVLLGVTKASLNTESWLAAASFQETTRVLTNAAIEGKVDRLAGLKENVIIGKLIPARSDIIVPRREHMAELDLPESLLLEEEAELERMLAEREAGGFGRGSVRGVILDEEDEDLADLDDDEEDDVIIGADEDEEV